MGFNKHFQKFKKKLLCETVAKALLTAVTIGAAAVFLVSLFYHLWIKETPLTLTCVIGGIVFAASFSVRFFMRYPTLKKVANRIDEMGLQERASTMLELRDETTQIAELQRKDAVDKIGQCTTKQLKWRPFKRDFILCLISVCIAAIMAFLPYNVFAFSRTPDTITVDQEEVIETLIAQLRKQVDESPLDDALKDALHEIIDELGTELKKADSDLERVALIEQARQKMMALLEKYLTKYPIGEALQRYDLTRIIGEGISWGDTFHLGLGMNALEMGLNANVDLVETLSETLTSALDDSGADSSDRLYRAIADFAAELLALDIDTPTFPKDLTTVFDTAEAAIVAALEKQALIELEKDKLDKALTVAKNDILGIETEESDEPPEGEEGPGSSQDNMEEIKRPTNGELSDGGGGGGIGAGGSGSLMTELIYDPVSGKIITYGEVFGVYYAEYLSALETGEVPVSLQEIIDKYFISLY